MIPLLYSDNDTVPFCFFIWYLIFLNKISGTWQNKHCLSHTAISEYDDFGAVRRALDLFRTKPRKKIFLKIVSQPKNFQFHKLTIAKLSIFKNKNRYQQYSMTTSRIAFLRFLSLPLVSRPRYLQQLAYGRVPPLPQKNTVLLAHSADAPVWFATYVLTSKSGCAS